MKVVVYAVMTVLGGTPQASTIYSDSCKPAMEQIVKSYGMYSYIRSWSNSSIKANNGKANLVVTCSTTK